MLLEGYGKRMLACAINKDGDLGCVSGSFNGAYTIDVDPELFSELWNRIQDFAIHQ